MTILHRFFLEKTRTFGIVIYICAATIAFFCLPITIALITSSIVYPTLQKYQKLTKLPYFVIVLLFSASIIAAFYFFLTSIHTVFQTLLPTLLQEIIPLFESYIQNEQNLLLIQQFEQLIDNVIQFVSMLSTKIIASFFDYFLFLIAFYFSIFECRKDSLWYFVYMPPSLRDKSKNYFKQFIQMLTTFIQIEFKLLFITFSIVAVCFYILGFQSPIHLALFIGIADLLPFIGVGLLFIPLIIYFFLEQKMKVTVTLFCIYICLIVVRQIAESLFWSSKLKIRTIHSFFISAGTVLIFGVYGLFIIPLFFLIAIHLQNKFNVDESR